ncbi:dipeptidase [uncultured Hyphomonas sp.]|uniref:dipeptidase n=1 Tax=uncultured Hyphomonas sp. TaxID=225298 RepID=UPI002AAB9571|nr:dipeptidase [uncultured Hyphomonas sp.]
MRTTLLAVSALALLGACAPKPAETEPAPPADVAETATPAEIHERLVVLDSHLDTPANLSKPDFDIMADNPSVMGSVQVDVPKMDRGGLDGGFWVIFTPQGPLTDESYDAAFKAATARQDEILKMVADNPDTFELAYTADDVERIAASGKKVVLQSIENSYPLVLNVENLQAFYDKGLRMVGLIHFRDNQFGGSATDFSSPEDTGLTDLGKDLVREANRLGIVVDGSHSSDASVKDMMEISTTPVVLTHTGLKSVYDHPRNIPDEFLQQIAEQGGVIQINAYSAYLEELEDSPERRAALEELQAEFDGVNPFTADDETKARYMERMQAISAEFPPPRSTFEKFMEHMLRALELVGPDHVGVGADWDGGGGVTGMEDVSYLPKITERLLAEGYTEEDLAKIWGGNLLRVMRQAEAAKETAE